MSTYTITGMGVRKPITVKEYDRAGVRVSAHKKAVRRTATRASKAGIRVSMHISTFMLVLLMVCEAVYGAYQVGRISMFTAQDWSNIANMSLDAVNEIIPLPWKGNNSTAMRKPDILMDGKRMNAAEFCTWARKTHKTETSYDVAEYCLNS